MNEDVSSSNKDSLTIASTGKTSESYRKRIGKAWDAGPAPATPEVDTKNGRVEKQRIFHWNSKSILSKVKILDLRSEKPDLYNAVIGLPPKLCEPKPNGIYMAPRFYKGISRNPKWLENWFNRRQSLQRVSPYKIDNLPELTVWILQLIASNRGFLTHDELLKEFSRYRMAPKHYNKLDAFESLSPQEDVEERKRKLFSWESLTLTERFAVFKYSKWYKGRWPRNHPYEGRHGSRNPTKQELIRYVIQNPKIVEADFPEEEIFKERKALEDELKNERWFDVDEPTDVEV